MITTLSRLLCWISCYSIILTIVPMVGNAQNSVLDSLKLDYENCQQEACVESIEKVIRNSFREPIDSVEKYVASGLEELENYPDVEKEIFFKYFLVQEYYDNSKYQKGIALAQEVLPLSIEHLDTLHISRTSRLMTAMYAKQSPDSEVIKIYKQWIGLADSLQLKKMKGEALSSLGNYQRNIGQLDKAMENLDQSIEIYESIHYKRGVHLALLRKGLVYSYREEDEIGLQYFFDAVEVLKGEMMTADSVLINDNIGRSLRKLKRYKEAEPYLIDAIRQAKARNWKSMYIHARNELMDNYYEDNQLEKALDIGEGLYKESQRTSNLMNIRDITRNLAEIYAALGRHDKAYDLQLENSNILDSIYDIDNTKAFAEMEAKYEVAEKEKEIAQQNLEIARKQNARNQLLGILGFLMIMAVGLYWWMRKRLQLKQREKEKLEEIDQLKTDFFANVSHELRTPLTLISGPINQVLDETKNSNHRKLMQLAVKNSNKLKHLINQLLDFSKVEAGKVRINKKDHDIISFAKGILMSFESLAEKRGVKLQFFSYDHELIVSYDEDMMEKVLSNLLSNALKFTKSNGEVKLMVVDKEDEVVLTVQDTGIGIGEDELPYVFDRFYVAEHSISKEYEGTGIGLSLVKDLVELHDGSVSVSSTQNKGTTFTILLPNEGVVEKDASIETEEKLLPSVSPESMVGETMTLEPLKEEGENLPLLLIIEDNEDVRFFIAQRLMNQFEIIEAKDGVEGEKMALERLPDLIICDIMMPRKNGYEVTRELKSRVETSHIPIILLTAKATREEKLEGLGHGADDYLIKPFDSKELQIKTNNIVANAKKLQSFLSDHLITESSTLLKNSVDKQFMENAYTVIQNNLSNEHFGVDDFAKGVGMSTTNLNRKLRGLSDQSSNQFIQSYRLKRATEMLKAKSGNVSEIAMEVGFSSNSYFIKVFKNKYGVTPNEYMKDKDIQSL